MPVCYCDCLVDRLCAQGRFELKWCKPVKTDWPEHSALQLHTWTWLLMMTGHELWAASGDMPGMLLASLSSMVLLVRCDALNTKASKQFNRSLAYLIVLE